MAWSKRAPIGPSLGAGDGLRYNRARESESLYATEEVCMPPKPAVSLAAVAGRRKATLELAQRLEQEGFSGIYCPSFGDGMGLCAALALTTHEIPFGTSIANIYTRHPADYAQTAALIHELSRGRFRFGIGISHGPTYDRLDLKVGKPLRDIRQFVDDLHTH